MCLLETNKIICPSQGNSSSKYRGYVFLLTLIAAFSAAVAGPWVYSDNSEPEEGTIRVTVLGSGTPDVRRHQVRLASPPFCFFFQQACTMLL